VRMRTPSIVHARTNQRDPHGYQNVGRGLQCFITNKVKGKVSPRTRHEGPEVAHRSRFTLSLTSALDGVSR
jgi:hypothetical protein